MVHHLPVPATVDIDVTPARDPANLGRLAAAFEDLDAGLLTGGGAGTWVELEQASGRHRAPAS